MRLCPNFPVFARFLRAPVQNFVRSPDFHAFTSRIACVQQNFVRSSPDYRAFTRFSCVHDQTFVHLTDIYAFTFRLFAFAKNLCICVQTFVRSPDFLHQVRQIFVPDFRVFMSGLFCVECLSLQFLSLQIKLFEVIQVMERLFVNVLP